MEDNGVGSPHCSNCPLKNIGIIRRFWFLALPNVETGLRHVNHFMAVVIEPMELEAAASIVVNSEEVSARMDINGEPSYLKMRVI
jgi:hypothetical protein